MAFWAAALKIASMLQSGAQANKQKRAAEQQAAQEAQRPARRPKKGPVGMPQMKVDYDMAPPQPGFKDGPEAERNELGEWSLEGEKVR